MDVVLATNCDDWEGIYIDGKLANQGHSLSVRDVVEALGFSVSTVEVDSDWLGDEGYLPSNLIDVVRA